MPYTSGKLSALLVLTPVIAGRETALAEVLARLPEGALSPLARTCSTHFGRWVVIDRLVNEGPPQQPDRLGSAYLLFSSHHDGGRDDYLETLRTVLTPEVEAIWGHCAGFPGCGDPLAFRDYFRRHQLEPSLYFAAYPEADLAAVRTALELRERLIAFAIAAQGLNAAALQSAYRRAFSAGAADEVLGGVQ